MDAPAHITKRFPHARQVALIERYVTRTVRERKGKRWVRNKQVKSAVRGLHHHQPGRPRGRPRPTSPGTSAATGPSRTRFIMSASGKTPAASAAGIQAKAAIRNTVIGILHLHRIPSIAAQLRICHRDPCRLPLRLPGLIAPPALTLTRNPAVT